MLPYIIILATVLIFYYFDRKNDNKNRRIFLLLATVIFLFAALRGDGSGDYHTYKKYSGAIMTLSDLFNNGFPMEFGFRLISYVVNKLYLDSQWVIISMNFISSSLIFGYIYKESKNKYLSVLIFLPWFFTMDMHATRSAVAAAFGLWAVHYFSKGQNFKFIIGVFLGMLFHKTASILLIVPIVKYLKVKTLVLLASVTYLLSFFVNFSYIPLRILQFIGAERFAFKLESYLTRDGVYPMSYFDPRIILTIIIIGLGYYVYKEMNKEETLLFKIIVLGFIVMSIFINNTFLSLRLSYFFYISMIIVIPVITIFLNKYLLCSKITLVNRLKVESVFVFIYIAYTLGTILLWAINYKLYIW